MDCLSLFHRPSLLNSIFSAHRVQRKRVRNTIWEKAMMHLAVANSIWMDAPPQKMSVCHLSLAADKVFKLAILEWFFCAFLSLSASYFQEDRQISCADDLIDVGGQRSGLRTAAKSRPGPSQRVEESSVAAKEEDQDAEHIRFEDATYEKQRRRMRLEGRQRFRYRFCEAFQILVKHERLLPPSSCRGHWYFRDHLAQGSVLARLCAQGWRLWLQ